MSHFFKVLFFILFSLKKNKISGNSNIYKIQLFALNKSESHQSSGGHTQKIQVNNYVPLKFNLYNGTKDPTEHIYHFRQLMALINDCEGLLCQVFPTSL